MAAIPRYRPHHGPPLLSAGFRLFFLLAGLAAAVEIPLWVLEFDGLIRIPTAFSPLVWHVHEMAFGFGLAVVSGFLFTSIPNWTGEMPLQGPGLAALGVLWLIGRVAVFTSGRLGEPLAAALDLLFPLALLLAMGREVLTGHNWRNAPAIGALSVLLGSNLWVHLGTLGVVPDPEGGNRLGIGALLMLISFMGGRLAPSFTRNWLARNRPGMPVPAPFGTTDRMAMAGAAVALLAWVSAPEAEATGWLAIVAGVLLLLRLARWQGWRTWPEPLLFALHLGYAWLAGGFLVLGFARVTGLLSALDAIHALTVGAIGTMTLAVMTRTTLGHTGRNLHAGFGTVLAYALVGIAALLRLAAPLSGAYVPLLWSAGVAWAAAFGLFVALYAKALNRPRLRRASRT